MQKRDWNWELNFNQVLYFYRSGIFRVQNQIIFQLVSHIPEGVVWRCSVEKVFLKISQNSPENTCAVAGVSLKNLK